MAAVWCGLLLLHKPSGPTSHDVVARVRRLTGERRVGHTGTLDPAASGLLPVVLGRVTRLIRFLPHQPKGYEGTLRLGVRTDSDDLTGAVIGRDAGAPPAADRVAGAAAALLGRQLQRPPAVSAKKVGGRRLYRLAREGRPAVAPPAAVEVFRFDLAPGPDAATWRFTAEVSAGTYIRALARDLGERLGCGAALGSLVRTRIGPLRLADAVPVPEAGPGGAEALASALIGPEAMPLELEALALDAAGTARFLGGAAVAAVAAERDRLYRVSGPEGRLLGVGVGSGGGALAPRVVVAGTDGGSERRPPRRPGGEPAGRERRRRSG